MKLCIRLLKAGHKDSKFIYGIKSVVTMVLLPLHSKRTTTKIGPRCILGRITVQRFAELTLLDALEFYFKCRESNAVYYYFFQ